MKNAQIAHHAITFGLTLIQVALGANEALFDRVVVPIMVTRPG